MPAWAAIFLAKLVEYFLPKVPGYLSGIFQTLKDYINKKIDEYEYHKRVDEALDKYKESVDKPDLEQEKAFEDLINAARRPK